MPSFLPNSYTTESYTIAKVHKFNVFFFRGTLLLFHPFRNEYEEITSQDLVMKYEKITSDELLYEKIQKQFEFFAPYQDLLDGIEAYVKEQREEDLEENEDLEEEEENIEVEDNDNLKLETTDVKDIKDFIKTKQSNKEVERETGLMQKEALLDKINMLNLQQRQIFDDIISRLRSGSFEDNPFLIYIRFSCIDNCVFRKLIVLQW
jgi:hypothetical protein